MARNEYGEEEDDYPYPYEGPLSPWEQEHGNKPYEPNIGPWAPEYGGWGPEPDWSQYADPGTPAPAPSPTPTVVDGPRVTPTPTPQPTPTPNPRGGGPDLGPLLQTYWGSFQKPQFGVAAKQLMDLIGPTPEFQAPALPTIAPFSHEGFAEPEPFSFEDYSPTTSEHVLGDPSFGFRKDIGEKALMNSRAAQGLARTGGTLKDLLDYNQNFATQEFSNIDNRRVRDYGVKRGNALENYQTNVGNKVTAYGLNRQNAADAWKANTDTTLGLYDRGFEAKRAEFEPKLYGWAKKGDLSTRAEEKAYDNSFNEFMGDFNIWRTGQNDIFDRLKWSSEFGLDAATR